MSQVDRVKVRTGYDGYGIALRAKARQGWTGRRRCRRKRKRKGWMSAALVRSPTGVGEVQRYQHTRYYVREVPLLATTEAP